MSMLIAAFMFIALLALAFSHLLWAMGRTWPIRNEQLLAHTVIGRPGVDRVPRLPSLLLAIFFLAAGILALALADHDSGALALTLVGVPPAALFLTRGFSGYTPGWAQKTPDPVFRLNDRRVYSPLCLFLGFGFVVLVIMRLL